MIARNGVGIAQDFVMKGVQAKTISKLTSFSKQAIKNQIERRKTTFIEVILNQELGEPFRRDTMKKPVRVAGISAEDME